MTEPITYRPLEDGEQAQAFALWYRVFEQTPGYFERYYQSDADPYYRDGDTLGAWCGRELVSAVHLCRRPVRWGVEELLCGGIANVATLPEFRRRGLSRRLLEIALAKMAGEGFHYSLLGTGVHGHYAALGWKQTQPPHTTVILNNSAELTDTEWRRLDSLDDLKLLYDAVPRPLQFSRPPAYFENWVGWNLRRFPPVYCGMQEKGYLILVVPDAADAMIFATEWRASNAKAETTLLQAAASEVRRRGRTQLGLEAMPQHLAPDFLATLGTIIPQTDPGSMLRNITLPEDVYRQVVAAYASGEAIWWSSDGF